MRHHRRGLELAGLEPDRGPVEVVEQPLTAAEQDRHDMDGELVDEIRAGYCCAVEAPPPIVTSFPSAAAMAVEGALDAVGDEVEVVPSSSAAGGGRNGCGTAGPRPTSPSTPRSATGRGPARTCCVP